MRPIKLQFPLFLATVLTNKLVTPFFGSIKAVMIRIIKIIVVKSCDHCNHVPLSSSGW